MTQPATAKPFLPDVATIGVVAPFQWLSLGWQDLVKSIGPSLAYGLGLAMISAAIVAGLFIGGVASWVAVAVGGFLFIAPMLAMGLYQAARLIERGETPSLGDMLFVKTASARNLAYLGLALVVIYFFWGRMAQLIYGLSTYQIHETFLEFLMFMIQTPEGRTMGVIGTVVGGAIAFLAYCLVVVSAPMLLDKESDVFVATVTSVRTVARNFLPMLVWAALIALLTFGGILTGCVGLIIVFPWIGLSTWHAYRALVPAHSEQTLAG